MKIRAYLINLDRMPQRLTHSQKMASEAGFFFERLNAVDGNDLDPDLVSRLEPGTLTGRRLGAGELGCLQSHRKAWQAILDSGEPYGAVFEDDMILKPDLGELLENGKWVPEGADIVRLETWGSWSTFLSLIPAGTVGNRTIYRLKAKVPGAGAYLLSREGARKLLQDSKAPNPDPVDLILFDDGSDIFSNLRIYQLSPAPAIQGHRARIKVGENSALASDRVGAGPVLAASYGQKRGRLSRLRLKIHALSQKARYVEVPFG